MFPTAMPRKKVIIAVSFLLFLVVAVFSKFSFSQESEGISIHQEEQNVYEYGFAGKIVSSSSLVNIYLHQKGFRTLDINEYQNLINSVVDIQDVGYVYVTIRSKHYSDNYKYELHSLGFNIIKIRDGKIKIRVPIDRFSEVVDIEWVDNIIYFGEVFQLSSNFRVRDVTTQGFSLINSKEFHKNGYKGENVKIAIIDQEFGRLSETIKNGDGNDFKILEKVICSGSSCAINNTPLFEVGKYHGTACYEILYDIAPEATYILVKNSGSELTDIISYLIGKGVDIISMSIGNFGWAGPLNGTDINGYNTAMKMAHDNGILTIVPAGNSRKQNYHENFSDTNGNGFHEFSENNEFMKIKLDKDISHDIALSWWDDDDNAHDISSLDITDEYQLWICKDNKNISSCNESIKEDNYPISALNKKGNTYYLKVERIKKGNNKKIGIYVNSNWASFDYYTPYSSIMPGSESPYAITVGAVSAGIGILNFGRDKFQNYSGEGPPAKSLSISTDSSGLEYLKPDVVSYADISSFSQGVWRGTSAATPHVAGMAALLLSQNPNQTVASLKNTILTNADDSCSDKNRCGHGIARLPLIGNPVVEFISPNKSFPRNVSGNNQWLRLTVFISSATGNFLGGLTEGDFRVLVDGTQASYSQSGSSIVQTDGFYIINVQFPSKPNGKYDLTVELTKDGKTASHTQPEAVIYGDSDSENVDVVQVIDRSGSMQGEPLDNAKSAANLFVDLMNTGDQIGVVSYDDGSRIDWPLTSIINQDGKDSPKSAISNLITTGGGTSIGSGLRDGYDELLRAGLDTHPWSIVLLSDGDERNPPHVSSVLPEIASSKTKVFTIGLGDAKESLMKNIADQTGGAYFSAPNEEDLQGIYNKISGVIAQRELLNQSTAVLNQGETKEVSVQIDGSITEVIFSTSWTSRQNTVDFILVTPSGSIIDPGTVNTNPDIAYFDGNTFAFYRISNPEVGTWKRRIHGSSIKAKIDSRQVNNSAILDDMSPDRRKQFLRKISQRSVPETVRLDVQAKTDLVTQVYLNESEYITGQPVSIKVVTLSSTPIVDSQTVAKVTYPDDSSSNVSNFRDDGKEWDRRPGDGVSTGALLKTAQPGVYTFNIVTKGTLESGEKFQRTKEVTITVSNKQLQDKDGDKMPDEWEESFAIEGEGGLDTSRNDANEDADGDGLNNLDEFLRGGHPFTVDTDEDGLRDGQEVFDYNTDITMADTDGGGKDDGVEISDGSNPLDAEDDSGVVVTPPPTTIPPANITISPTTPTSNDTVTVTASGEWNTSCTPTSMSIDSSSGNATRLRLLPDFSSSDTCLQVITPWSLSTTVGTLPQGTHSFEVFRVIDNSDQVLGTSSVSVQAPPVVITPPPTTDPTAQSFASTAIVMHSNKCLDIDANSTKDGANAHQFGCHGNDNQSFVFTPVDGKTDVYTIKAKHSNKCLDVKGASTKDGSSVLQWSCGNNKLNQQFTLESVGTKIFQIKPLHSGQCLDVFGNKETDKADVIQWPCGVDKPNQQWLLNGYQ